MTRPTAAELAAIREQHAQKYSFMRSNSHSPEYEALLREQHKLDSVTLLLAEIDALTAQVAALTAERDEETYVREKLSKLCAETIVALRGPEPELTRWSYHNLPELAAALVTELAEVRRVRDEWCAEYTKARDDRDALRAQLAKAREALQAVQLKLAEYLERLLQHRTLPNRWVGEINDIVSDYLARTAPPAEMTPDAISDIGAERKRQVEIEGWSPAHDDEHQSGELAQAASCYALRSTHHHDRAHDLWPWSDEWWKPKDRRRDLVRAGALIVAEIERLDRLARTSPSAPEGAQETKG